MIQSLGWALSAYNLARDSLWPGFACDVQGFFINVGDVGSSLWSLVIAIHTVLLLAGTQRTRAWAAEASTTGKGRWIVVASVWGLVIGIGLCGPLIIEPLQPWNGPFCMMPPLLVVGLTRDSQQRWRWMVLDWPKLPS